MKCFSFACLLWLVACIAQAEPDPLAKLPGSKPRNIVFILTDDHRYDALGFLGHPFLETPHLDALARGGVHFQNAFVTTALCSPSRASILTGLYAHRHGVVDNYHPVSERLVFFSEHLQQAGYQTGFFGKWHMGGEHDEPQRGWDRWVSFKGQGSYWADNRGSTRIVAQSSTDLNVDGRRTPRRGYITDELTDYALEWLQSRDGAKPFMMYISHKAVHSDFVPANRHKDRYKDKPVTSPATQADTPANRVGKPMWVTNQRNSWHGVDFPYHTDLDVANYYRRYCETLLAVDDNVGRVMAALKSKGLLDSTLIIYMGDNGFMFGEHGLIDKRCAYEESMRVPLIAHCPELFAAGTKMPQLVANVDIAPTILESAGLQPPESLDGRSWLPLARVQAAPWRDSLLYEYYWERNYPQTPTMHALRGERFKYIRYHGLWDTDELYDLQADPRETKNLVAAPEHQATVQEMNAKLFATLEASGGMQIPLLPDAGQQYLLRRTTGGREAEFPREWLRQKSAKE